MADRDVLDVIEREIADEVRTRFPGAAVQRVRLLQYGDHPMIEPGDLWVRVLLAGDPEDYERILRAFQDAHEPAIDSFMHYLTETLVEIRIVEFMCGEDPIGREGHGPRFSRAAGARLADVAEWEHGAITPVVAELGPPGLDTLDTLIRAGFAATRPQAIRWALDRIRERPAYQRVRDLQRDTDALKDAFYCRVIQRSPCRLPGHAWHDRPASRRMGSPADAPSGALAGHCHDRNRSFDLSPCLAVLVWT